MIAFGIGNRSAITGPNPNADSFSQGPTLDTSSAIVQLKGDPLSTYSGTKPAHGRKIDFNSNAVQIISCPVEDWAERIQTMAALERTQRNRHERVRYLA